MGLFSGLFGTSSGTTDVTTSPWGPAVPHYKNIFGQAQNLYNQGAPALATQTQGALSDTISGRYLDPNSNPFFAQSVRDALGQAGSVFAGQYGGPAGQNLGNSGYQEGLARNLGTIATNAYADNYARERQNQMGALSMGSFDPAWENLMRYKEAITTPFNTSQQPYFQNNTANTLGLALGGLALGKGFGLFGGGK